MTRKLLTLFSISALFLLLGVAAPAQQTTGEKAKSDVKTGEQKTEAGARKAEDAITGKVDINNASKHALMELKPVSAAMADKIIANRPYTDKSELRTRHVVSQKVYDEIENKLVVHPESK